MSHQLLAQPQTVLQVHVVILDSVEHYSLQLKNVDGLNNDNVL